MGSQPFIVPSLPCSAKLDAEFSGLCHILTTEAGGHDVTRTLGATAMGEVQPPVMARPTISRMISLVPP